jgi:hypothetical protein
MAKNKKKQDSSWKNYEDYRKGKGKLENSILQHPEEDSGDKSVYNFMKNRVQRNIWVLPYKQFEKVGKKK